MFKIFGRRIPVFEIAASSNTLMLPWLAKIFHLKSDKTALKVVNLQLKVQ